MSKVVVFDFYNVLYSSQEGVNSGILELIFDLHNKGIPLYIFTNSSSGLVQSVGEKYSFLEYFNGVLTCEKNKKPSSESFYDLISMVNKDSADIILVDDFEENISAGESFGIIGILYTNTDELKKTLSEFGV